MKKLEAVIAPEKLDTIREQLAELGIFELVLTETKQSDGKKDEFGQESAGPLQKRIKLELILGDRQARKVTDVILRHGGNESEDRYGYVAVLDVNETFQVCPPFFDKARNENGIRASGRGECKTASNGIDQKSDGADS
jgi:nitrogen regulatory protein PII